MHDDLGGLLFRRLQVRADMTGDGIVTISDVVLWLQWLFALPGDAAVLAMAGTPVGTFFEVGRHSLGGNVSLGLSVAFWGLLWIALAGGRRRG